MMEEKAKLNFNIFKKRVKQMRAPITDNSAMIAKGSTIIVADDESRTMVRCEKEVLESDISSFHLRIWL